MDIRISIDESILDNIENRLINNITNSINNLYEYNLENKEHLQSSLYGRMSRYRTPTYSLPSRETLQRRNRFQFLNPINLALNLFDNISLSDVLNMSMENDTKELKKDEKVKIKKEYKLYKKTTNEMKEYLKKNGVNYKHILMKQDFIILLLTSTS